MIVEIVEYNTFQTWGDRDVNVFIFFEKRKRSNRFAKKFVFKNDSFLKHSIFKRIVFIKLVVSLTIIIDVLSLPIVIL